MGLSNLPGYFQDWCRRAGRDGSAWFNSGSAAGTYIEVPEFYRSMLAVAGADAASWLDELGASKEFAGLPDYAQKIMRLAGRNANKWAGAAPPAFLPTDLGAKLRGWYDMSDPAARSIVDTNRVASITDKSGVGANFAQGSVTERPYLNLAFQNGLDVLSIYDQYIGTEAPRTWTGSDQYWFLATNQTTIGGGGSLGATTTLMHIYGIGLDRMVHFKRSDAGTFGMARFDGTSYLDQIGTTGRASKFTIWGLKWAADNSREVTMNGTVVATGSSPRPGGGESNLRLIPDFSTTARGFYFGELVMAQDLSAGQYADVINFMTTKWNPDA
jgi:hypothetical protein